MKRDFVNYQGQKKAVDCLGCDRERGDITIGGIVQTAFFDAHQDFEIPIRGFVILSSRRHIQSMDEFTTEERVDFMNLIVELRRALRETLGIDIVCIIQEEDTSHHFHVWIFPRYPWMEEQFGRKIESVRPIMEHARSHMKTNENLKIIEEANLQMRAYFEV